MRSSIKSEEVKLKWITDKACGTATKRSHDPRRLGPVVHARDERVYGAERSTMLHLRRTSAVTCLSITAILCGQQYEVCDSRVERVMISASPRACMIMASSDVPDNETEYTSTGDLSSGQTAWLSRKSSADNSQVSCRQGGFSSASSDPVDESSGMVTTFTVRHVFRGRGFFDAGGTA